MTIPKQTPDKETVCNIIAAAGWAYVFDPDSAPDHSLRSPEGHLYVLPVMIDILPHAVAWDYYTTLLAIETRNP